MRKEIVFEDHAWKEYHKLALKIREEFVSLLEKLEEKGKLYEPEGKKINQDLFEMRIRFDLNQWRGLYGYFKENKIIILRFFQKKTQKTPKKEMDLALKRLKRL
jgi:phage-related protein